MLAADEVATWAYQHQVRALETLTRSMQTDGRLSQEAQRVAEYLDQANEPVSRSSIRTEVFSRNCAKGMLERVWEELSLTGQYHRFKKRIGNGRPTEFWGTVEQEPDPAPESVSNPEPVLAPAPDSESEPQDTASSGNPLQDLERGLGFESGELTGDPGSHHFAAWLPPETPRWNPSQMDHVPEDPSS